MLLNEEQKKEMAKLLLKRSKLKYKAENIREDLRYLDAEASRSSSDSGGAWLGLVAFLGFSFLVPIGAIVSICGAFTFVEFLTTLLIIGGAGALGLGAIKLCESFFSKGGALGYAIRTVSLESKLERIEKKIQKIEEKARSIDNSWRPESVLNTYEYYAGIEEDSQPENQENDYSTMREIPFSVLPYESRIDCDKEQESIKTNKKERAKNKTLNKKEKEKDNEGEFYC